MPEPDLIFALELLTSPPDAPGVQGADPGAMEVAEKARSWTAAPNVIGSGIGLKIASGTQSSQQSLKFYVANKLPNRLLRQEERIPAVVQLPGQQEVLTDVEAIGEQRVELLSTRVRPIVPGYSIGRIGGNPGTLGAIVVKAENSMRLLVLSNSHVLANYGLSAPGEAIIQPASVDGGSESDVVARLLESVAFSFEPGFNNICDAAVATVDDRANLSSMIPLVPGFVGDVGPVPAVGDLVQKTGRTTGHTFGRVKDIHYRTLMSYPKAGGGWGTVGFRDQVLCEKYSDGGDSGSLVCDADGRAVGLHWAGSSSTSVFSPVQSVLNSLGIKLWNGGV